MRTAVSLRHFLACWTSCSVARLIGNRELPAGTMFRPQGAVGYAIAEHRARSGVQLVPGREGVCRFHLLHYQVPASFDRAEERRLLRLQVAQSAECRRGLRSCSLPSGNNHRWSMPWTLISTYHALQPSAETRKSNDRAAMHARPPVATQAPQITRLTCGIQPNRGRKDRTLETTCSQTSSQG